MSDEGWFKQFEEQFQVLRQQIEEPDNSLTSWTALSSLSGLMTKFCEVYRERMEARQRALQMAHESRQTYENRKVGISTEEMLAEAAKIYAFLVGD